MSPYLGSALDARAQQLQAVCAVVARGTLVERLEVDGVLESAVFDESTLRNVLVVLSQTHDEAQVDLGVRVQLAGAELDDVAEALGGAVFAFDSIVGRRAGTLG